MPLRTWLLSVARVHKVTKELNCVRFRFVSDAATVNEAFEAIHHAGFACVNKTDDRVIPAGGLSVRLSMGEL